MHIILPSDVFPPGSVGGAAWSSYTLARALCAQGHTVTAVVPQPDLSGTTSADVLGVPTVRWGYAAPPIPFVQNYFRHERLWHPLARLITQVAHNSSDAGQQTLVIHAQHVQTTPAAVIAGCHLNVPVVATVRDHWPWDYFATGLHANCLPYPQTTWASLMTDLPNRLGTLKGVLTLPALPYLLAHTRHRAAFLAQADAVIAVSNYIAGRLEPLVPPERLHVIPNMVDIAATEQIAATPPQLAIDEPFLLYVGKLERNKGAGMLIEVFRTLAAGQHYTLVIAGNGSLKAELAATLAQSGVRAHFLAWADHDEVLRLMTRCTLLLFPSLWGEPLSRVLLEASAVGAPILAMPTGGTRDIITDGVNGALAATPEQFAHRLAALLRDPRERQRLGEGARQTARQRFSVAAVVPRVEDLYARLLEGST